MQRGLGQALVMVIPALTLCANVATAQYSCTSAWGSLGPADGQFEGPQGIAVAPNGHVYVAEGANNCRVQEFTAGGTFVRKWGKMGSGPGQFYNGLDVAVDPDGFVYVADANAARVQKFSPDGTLLQSWGSRGAGPGQFAGSDLGIAVDNGRIYFADAWNHRVEVFDAAGAYITEWVTADSSGYWDPCALAADGQGRLYVTAYAVTLPGSIVNNARVLEFDDMGALHKQWGTFGTASGELAGPCKIAVDGDRLVVVDVYARRVALFARDGTYLGDAVNECLHAPFAVASKGHGTVYVTDYDSDSVVGLSGCATSPTESATWGRLKSRYRPAPLR